MKYIEMWIQNILYVNILCLLVNGLVKSTPYEKYIRFFTGFFIILSLMKPVIDLGEQKLVWNSKGMEERIEEYFGEMEGAMQESLKEVYPNGEGHIDIEMEQTESEEGN